MKNTNPPQIDGATPQGNHSRLSAPEHQLNGRALCKRLKVFPPALLDQVFAAEAEYRKLSTLLTDNSREAVKMAFADQRKRLAGGELSEKKLEEIATGLDEALEKAEQKRMVIREAMVRHRKKAIFPLAISVIDLAIAAIRPEYEQAKQKLAEISASVGIPHSSANPVEHAFAYLLQELQTRQTGLTTRAWGGNLGARALLELLIEFPPPEKHAVDVRREELAAKQHHQHVESRNRLAEESEKRKQRAAKAPPAKEIQGNPERRPKDAEATIARRPGSTVAGRPGPVE